MKLLLKFVSWFLAFFLFWTGIAVIFPQWHIFPFGTLVDILNMLDFGIHEMGHMVLSLPGNRYLGVLGGSLFQWGAPLLMLVYSTYKRRFTTTLFFLFWLGQSLIQSTPYIADARSQSLPLISPFFFTGEPITHDWNFMLGQLNLLWADKIIGGLFFLVGCFFMGLAVLLLVIPMEWILGWGSDLLKRVRSQE